MGIGRNFVNSMARQVGRDTGRVISNSLYGDAHSIPIRRVGNKFYNQENILIPLEDARATLERDGYVPKIKLQNMGVVALLFFLSITTVFISPILFIYRGIYNLNRKDIILSKPFVSVNYVQDRRYRNGVRPAGTTQAKSEIKLPANDEEKLKYRNRGWIYIFLGIILLIIQSAMLYKTK